MEVKVWTLLSLVLVLSVLAVSGCTTEGGQAQFEIRDFDDCVAAGNPVMESYPRHCRTDDGRTFTEDIEEMIGGERDMHGCLGPAGYTWSEEVGACIRTWELDSDQKEAASMAVEHIGWEYATTVVEVSVQRCPGCFLVTIEQGEERESSEVQINNWTIGSG